MAKNTKNQLNEVEIVRRRDGVVDTTEPLDAPARRALADARLRALALTLNVNEISQGGDYPGDTELLAYLLDTLPEQRRHEVELAARRNARAFGRLVALRTAFNTHIDKRDRRRAEHPARNVVRRTAQEVEVRKLGGELLFRDAPAPVEPMQRMALRTPARAFSQKWRDSVLNNTDVPPEKRRPAQMRLDPKTGLMLRNYLQRASLPLTMGRHLIEEVRSLLAQLEKLNLDSKARKEEPRPAGEPPVNELQQVSDRLVDVLFRLQRESDQLADDIRRIVLVAIDGPPSDKFSYRSDYVSEADFASRSFASADFQAYMPDLEESPPGWYPTKQVLAGEWSLLLAGVAAPRPILTATLQAIGERDLGDLPTLTLVQPNEGFEVADVDSVDLNKVNLPTGRSILLIQGEKEIWQIPLILREG